MACVVVAVGAGLTIAIAVPGAGGHRNPAPLGGRRRASSSPPSRPAVMMFATVWYAMREISRAEAAMEVEYERSEALLANILPATHRRAAQGSGARHHRRPLRRRLDPVRRHRRLHRARQRDRRRRSGAFPRPALHHLRPAGRPARPGEDQDHRRLLHGGQRGARARGPTTSRRWPARPGHVACGGRSARPATASGAAADGYGRRARWWPGWSARAGSSTTCGATPSTSPPGWSPPTRRDTSRCPQDVYERLKDRVRARGARRRRRQGQGHHAHLVPGRPQEPKTVACRAIDSPRKRLGGSRAPTG